MNSIEILRIVIAALMVAMACVATLLMPIIKRINIAPLRDKHSDSKWRNNDK
ncbi:MAG: hypothetical protein Q4D35_00225 [Ruminococcus sp.]|nr:hypothetical protein [Ruminococcus sp.]